MSFYNIYIYIYIYIYRYIYIYILLSKSVTYSRAMIFLGDMCDFDVHNIVYI